jgi:hypothetical protein
MENTIKLMGSVFLSALVIVLHALRILLRHPMAFPGVGRRLEHRGLIRKFNYRIVIQI